MQYSMGVEPRSSRDYAAELNPEQYAAVTTTQRHALVIAGAGSGKTRTLTYRVAWLLDQGVAPWRILLLTFTNKAAREMLQRVEQLTGAPADRLWGGTFHSVANRLLRRHAEVLGYRPGFTIMDSDDQKALMRALVREYAPKESRDRRFPKAELLLGLHSLAANTERDWLDVLLEDYPQFESRQELIGQIFEAYAERKRQGNCMDFDDLLLNLLRLLREHENIRDELRNRFCHVLVDEYQDTNAPQEEIIRLIAGGPDAHLMVVGDDAQSIYSWRGADVRHILSFGERYPDAVIYRIETNYRSVPAILAVSNVAIAGNTQRYEKELRSARPACLAPVRPLSGYTSLASGLWGYRAVRDASTEYFIERLPKGRYTLTDEHLVDRAGNYSCGTAVLQSVYAPEFSTQTAGFRLTCEP